MEFKVSDTTLRARRDEWIDTGVFDRLEAETRVGYDRIIGLGMGVVAIDGANRNDIKLLEPTLDAVVANRLIADIELLTLDSRLRLPDPSRAPRRLRTPQTRDPKAWHETGSRHTASDWTRWADQDSVIATPEPCRAF